jgi:BirA family biotin operon repressor/biotin-[acetyl-CoA-carboxylase] ligase
MCVVVAGWRVATYDQVKSTQDLAIAAAIAGEPGRLAVLAARQSAGRGRDGRVWHAPVGNLNFSALLRPGPIRPVPAQWSLAAGVAVHDAVSSFLSHPAKLMLKWPNDLLFGGAKLAGILIDSALSPDGLLDWVVVGIGVNLAEAPVLPGRPAACLAASGITVTPDALAGRLMALLDRWGGQDLAAIRAAWLARAHPLGTPLHVQQGGQVIEGHFDGLAPDGRLILDGQILAGFGDVFLEGPDAAGG